jgi:3-methyladenine DNA glycosylase Tag
MNKNNIEKRIATNRTVITFKKGIAKLERKLEVEDNKIIKNLQKLKAVLANVKIDKKTRYKNEQLISLCEKVAESQLSRMKMTEEILTLKSSLVKWVTAIKELIG